MAEGNNNERKTFNRRARTGWAAMVLFTTAFYICMVFVKENPLEWVKLYGIFLGAITGFIIGGISVTDAIGAWKQK